MPVVTLINKILQETAQKKLLQRQKAYRSILKLRKKVKGITQQKILRWLHESRK